MKRWVCAADLAATLIAVAGCAGGHAARGTLASARVSSHSGRRVGSSRLILHGRVRCTATVAAPVQAGQPLDVSFALHNDTGSTVHVRRWPYDLWFVVKAPDGTTYDSRVALERARGAMPRPLTLRAGATRTTGGGSRLRVHWSGPLRITPGCEQTKLPSLRVGVVVTRDGATTVDGAERDASRAAPRMAPEWTWNGSRWEGPGGSRCGGETFAGLDLDFISVCPH
jgi:hypothetical protein